MRIRGIRGLAVLATAAIAASVTPAVAYTPATFDNSAVGGGAQSELITELTHSKVDGEEPNKGDTFTYTGSVRYGNLGEPGVTYAASFHVSTTAAAPFTRALRASDLRLQDVRVSNLNCDADLTTCEADVAITGPNPSVSFNLEARVKEDAADGTVISGSLGADVSSTPDISLIERGKSFRADAGNQCAGVWTFKTGLTAGAWLADIKFADAEGQGKVSLDDTALTFNTTAGQDGLAADQIAVFDSSGRNITSRIDNLRGSYTWKASDPTPPTQQQSVIGSEARWLSSANWPIDAAKYTGDTWIPAGSTIVVTKHGHFNACLSGRVAGYAADYDPSRPAGIATEIVRPQMEDGDSARTSFALPTPPGTQTAQCAQGIYFSQQYTQPIQYAYSQEYGLLDGMFAKNGNEYSSTLQATPKPIAALQNGGGQGASVTTLAASEEWPTRFYYISEDSKNRRTLSYYDSADQSYHDVSISGANYRDGSNSPNADTANSLAFSKGGILWAVDVENEGSLYGKYRLWSLNLKDSNPQWQHRSELTGKQFFNRLSFFGAIEANTLGQIKGIRPFGDMVFDDKGNLYYIVSFSSGRGSGSFTRTALFKINAKDIESLDPAKRAGQFLGYISSTSNVYALAWGPDGYMYYGSPATAGLSSGTGKVVRIDNLEQVNEEDFLPTTAVTVNAPEPKFSARNPRYPDANKLMSVDFASCAYGTSGITGGEPEFKVYKSVVDPSTGLAVAPGTLSPHAVQVRPDGSVRTRFYVAVANTGGEAGTPATIHDTVSMPDGFAVERVLVDGREVSRGSAFDLTPGELQSGQVQDFMIEVVARAQDLTRVNWRQSSTCGATGYDSYQGGFFNQVTMDGDSDGTDNNFGCVPTQPESPAKVRLIKKIVDNQGNEISSLAGQSRNFQLSATRVSGGVSVSGASPSSGRLGVDANVLAGDYVLREQITDSASARFTAASSWTCLANGHRVPVSQSSVVTVPAGQTVTCTIANTVKPDFDVIKTAATAADRSNPHIGTEATMDSNNVAWAEYDITVRNRSGFPGTSDAVVEYFTPPTGLVFAHEGRNRIQAQIVNGSETTRVDPASFRQGYQLTSGVTLRSGQSATYRIRIPLAPDNRRPGRNEPTVFGANIDTLKKCTAGTANGQKYSTEESGAPNRVSLVGESHNYSRIPVEDNVACVPVGRPPIPDLPPIPLTGGVGTDSFYRDGLTLMGAAALGLSTVALRKRRRRTANSHS